MRKSVSMCFAVALVALWGIAAQGQEPVQAPAPPSEGPSQQGPDRAPAPTAKPITLAGCVARDGEAFKLTKAKAAAGTPATTEVKSEYTLSAGAGVNLAPHVDHQVELTGTTSADASFAVTALKMIAAKCE